MQLNLPENDFTQNTAEGRALNTVLLAAAGGESLCAVNHPHCWIVWAAVASFNESGAHQVQLSPPVNPFKV